MIDLDGLELHLQEIIDDNRGHNCYTKAENVMKLVKLIREAEKDAARYRWLRDCHWSESSLCVVAEPKSAVILGSNCPSRELLDAAIDEAMKCK